MSHSPAPGEDEQARFVAPPGQGRFGAAPRARLRGYSALNLAPAARERYRLRAAGGIALDQKRVPKGSGPERLELHLKGQQVVWSDGGGPQAWPRQALESPDPATVTTRLT